MTGPPSSRTITLLFTDIEGSTSLLRELRDDYGDLIAEHQRVLRRAFAEYGGREVDAQGDAFFVVFDSACEAVGAAVAGERALVTHDWPLPTRVRVRMGIHTGEVTVDGDAYLGLAVHHGARICSAANGGQVLLSSAARAVLGEDDVAGTALFDLGEHALKDFDRPEHLYQVIIDGVPADLRRPRTAVQEADDPVGFAGRERVLTDAVADTVRPPDARQPSRRWQRSFAEAAVAVGRNPFDVASLAVLVLLGVLTTPWFVVVAVAVCAVMVAAKAVAFRHASEDIAGLRLYAMHALAPDDEIAARVKELGALLVKASTLAHDVDERLAAHDRTLLAHELQAGRASAVSAAHARRLDALSGAIDALDALAECRAALAREMRRVGGRAEALRATLFEIRVGHGSREPLLDEVVTLHADLEDCVAAVRESLLTAPRLPSSAASSRRRRLARFRPRSGSSRVHDDSPMLEARTTLRGRRP